MNSISFYCINFLDEERKQRMLNRFTNFGLELQFVPPVYITDERVNIENADKRTWSIMFQHLDSIQHFYTNTDNEYLVVCEDDILLSKNFLNGVNNAINHLIELNLDIILLGYLLNIKGKINDQEQIVLNHEEYLLIKQDKYYGYYNMPYHLWGSQMYLITRTHAKFLLDKYTKQYAIDGLNLGRPFNPDWTLTKDGNHALIYPMLALEEGGTKTDHIGQNEFHQLCFELNYDSNTFI